MFVFGENFTSIDLMAEQISLIGRCDLKVGVL